MAAKVGDLSLILKLLGGIIIGALLGLYIGENAEGSLKHVMDVVVSLRHIFGQIIFFLVPLVIVGFITPAIVRLGQNASKILLVAVALAYVSSLGAALFSMISGSFFPGTLGISTTCCPGTNVPVRSARTSPQHSWIRAMGSFRSITSLWR